MMEQLGPIQWKYSDPPRRIGSMKNYQARETWGLPLM